MKASKAAGCIGNGSPPSLASFSFTSGSRKSLHGFGVELVDDRLRRRGRREHADPEIVFGVGEAGLHGGRHVRQRRRAGRAADREHRQFPGRDQAARGRQRNEIEIAVAGHDRGEPFRPALVGNVLDVDPGRQPEPFAVEMGGAAGAGGGVVHRARLRLRGIDQILERLVLVRRHHQHVRQADERRYPGEVARRVITRIRIGRRHDHVRGGMDQQRVAVGIGLGDGAHADRAAGAEAVLDHDRLAELGRETLGDRAGDDVGPAAGAERHDDADRLCRPRLTSCAARKGRKQDG